MSELWRPFESAFRGPGKQSLEVPSGEELFNRLTSALSFGRAAKAEETPEPSNVHGANAQKACEQKPSASPAADSNSLCKPRQP